MTPADVLQGVSLVVDGLHALAPMLPAPVADKLAELKAVLSADAVARQDALADTLEAEKFGVPVPFKPPAEP